MPGYPIPGYDYPGPLLPAPPMPCHPGAALVLLLRRRPRARPTALAPPWLAAAHFRRRRSAPVLAPDLLTALIDFLKASASVRSVLTANGLVKVYSGLPEAGAVPPYLSVLGYDEEDPGESFEDRTTSVVVRVVAPGEDECRRVAKVVKDAVDTLAINPDLADQRAAFVWSGGEETSLDRNGSKPYRGKGLAAGGGYQWVEDVTYDFWYRPTE